jgi:hypothetical protein
MVGGLHVPIAEVAQSAATKTEYCILKVGSYRAGMISGGALDSRTRRRTITESNERDGYKRDVK